MSASQIVPAVNSGTPCKSAKSGDGGNRTHAPFPPCIGPLETPDLQVESGVLRNGPARCQRRGHGNEGATTSMQEARYSHVAAGMKVRIPAGARIVYDDAPWDGPAEVGITRTVSVVRVTHDPLVIYWTARGGYLKGVELADTDPVDGDVPSKQCGRCGETKPLALFWVDKRKADGRQTRCADCANRRRAETDLLGPQDPGPMHIPVDHGYETPCWIWQWGHTGRGYGAMVVEGKQQPAHRWVYEQERGPIPDGLQLDHLCRQRSCVNPDHLEPVTCAVNIQRGLRAKLTEAEVREILASPLSLARLSAIYGVSGKQIWNIKQRFAWRNLDAT